MPDCPVTMPESVVTISRNTQLLLQEIRKISREWADPGQPGKLAAKSRDYRFNAKNDEDKAQNDTGDLTGHYKQYVDAETG